MKYFTFILVLAASHCFAQKDTIQLPYKDGKVLYQQIDSINGETKTQLYDKAKLWVVNNFKSANAVIQIDDKENGQIVGKGFENIYGKTLGVTYVVSCYFTVKIDCRDNKVRVSVYDIYFMQNSGSFSGNNIESMQGYKGIGANTRKKTVVSADTEIKTTLSDLRKALQNDVADKF